VRAGVWAGWRAGGGVPAAGRRGGGAGGGSAVPRAAAVAVGPDTCAGRRCRRAWRKHLSAPRTGVGAAPACRRPVTRSCTQGNTRPDTMPIEMGNGKGTTVLVCGAGGFIGVSFSPMRAHAPRAPVLASVCLCMFATVLKCVACVHAHACCACTRRGLVLPV